MFKAKRIDNGKEVEGWLVECDGKYYIAAKVKDTHWDLCNVFAGFIEVQPRTIAMQTGVKDKNENMIYGSILINGVMTEGGDRVIAADRKVYDVVFGEHNCCDCDGEEPCSVVGFFFKKNDKYALFGSPYKDGCYEIITEATE